MFLLPRQRLLLSVFNRLPQLPNTKLPFTYGPELLIGDPTALNANVVVSGGVATFTNANLNDAAYWDLPLEDNVTYRFAFRLVSISKGNAKPRVFGATAAHSGAGHRNNESSADLRGQRDGGQ
jgi:hypothetical protein